MQLQSFNVLLLVPTGINAAIGGYAGDALPVARAIASIADHVITHPNVLNGASLYWSMPNVLYTEGYALDRMARGDWGLRPVRANRIGVILDRGMESDLELRHRQVIAAAQATLGLNITDVIVTDCDLGVELRSGDSGATWGTIANLDSLLRAADKLIKVSQVQAIAVVARFPDDPDSEALQNYRQGKGVDALAGAEAVISHAIVREFAIPCAHAPALQPLPLDASVAPRAAAEELGYTFLPCVLVGLSRAPKIIRDRTWLKPEDITADDISAIVTPYRACGGAGLLALNPLPHVQTIFVKENHTALNVTPEMLGLKGITVTNYWEAIGILTAIKAGINPQSLR
ncbi:MULTISPECIES: DUF3326 domain-containing protein [Pseudanabaena]|uniref:DUF3326 domain-containing protein n=2 Tax=Pseudanabaena TaxID=1152 RepID=L8N8B0_9CYAN|nr:MULTISPECIES: DUF3326 domain-containing protein [Pseudanabaena]ELS34473.1 hypothetical protein Pse7429DRAFT_0468 [Pseudanabaena biceps PCC 7429]MDG3493342.1 DUF3326 domain-containing protein [Pseudanabaena catenata USMAC16]